MVIIENAEIIIDKKRQYFYNNYTQNYNKDTNREMKHMANNCKFCGNPLEDWMAYCDNCGRKQDADAQNAGQPSQQPSQPHTQSVPAQQPQQSFRQTYQQPPVPRQPMPPQDYQQQPPQKKSKAGLIIGIVGG